MQASPPKIVSPKNRIYASAKNLFSLVLSKQDGPLLVLNGGTTPINDRKYMDFTWVINSHKCDPCEKSLTWCDFHPRSRIFGPFITVFFCRNSWRFDAKIRAPAGTPLPPDRRSHEAFVSKNRMVTVVMLLVPVSVSIAIVIGDSLRCVLNLWLLLSLLVLLCLFCIAIAITILIVVVVGVMIAVCTLVFCSLLIVLGVFLLALIVTFVFSLFFLPLSFMVLMFLRFLLLLLFVQDGYYLPYTMSNSFYETHPIFKEKSKLTTSAIRHRRARLTYESSTCFDGRSAACEGGLLGLGNGMKCHTRKP